MAFVFESRRFSDNPLNSCSPGPGTYISQDSAPNLHHQRNENVKAPFGSNQPKDDRQPKLEAAAASLPKLVNVPHQFHQPLLPSSVFMSGSHRFQPDESSKQPGPGSYNIVSFTDKLRDKVIHQMLVKDSRNVPKYKMAIKGDSQTTPETYDYSAMHSQGECHEPQDKQLETNGKLRPLLGKGGLKGTTTTEPSQDSVWFKEYDKGVGVINKCIKWGYSDLNNDRFKHMVNKESLDPQLYSPKIYQPKYKQGPSSSFSSGNKRLQKIK